MSEALIQAALEEALNGLAPSLATAWQNAPFTPPAASTPYQKAATLFAAPENPNITGTARRERGIFQVTLMYPLQEGTGAALARAALLRATFYRGARLTKSGVSAIIEKTPEIAPGAVVGDRWAVPVRIRFYSIIGA